LDLEIDVFSYLLTLKIGQDFITEDEELFNVLKTAKSIVDNDKDEYYNLKYKAHYHRFDNMKMILTINPTLHCNFNCSYCFEGAKPSIYMTDEVEDAIVNLIKKQKNINSVHNTWFGGEPLMAFERIISLTNKMKNLEINYSADMVTNGYLMNEYVINELDNLKITSIQITIDGLETTHDKRRPLTSGKGSFQQIIDNIDLLRMKKPDFDIAIRVNLDNNNKNEFIEICRFFCKRYKTFINIAPGFVSDKDGCRTSSCLMNRDVVADFLLDLYKKHKYATSNLYPDSHVFECQVRNPHSLVIGPQGEIYKCWNDVGNKDKITGNIISKQSVNTNLLLRYYTAGDPFDDNDCKECFHLPICGGGCPYLRIKREYEDKNIDVCYVKKDRLQEFLEYYCEFKKLKEKHYE
jgi:uncharacterized protein